MGACARVFLRFSFQQTGGLANGRSSFPSLNLRVYTIMVADNKL